MAKKTTEKKTTSVASKTSKSTKTANNKKAKKVVASEVEPKIEETEIVEETVESTYSTSETPKMNKTGKSFKIHRSTVIIVLVLVILGLILYFGRGFFVAAVVNGQPISRLTLVDEAEKQSGKQAMAMLVRNALVEQEAKKQNVEVSDEEVDKQIKTIKDNLAKQGQNLDDMLALEGMTKDDLNRIIRLDLLVGKLVGEQIKITDKDVDNYIKENKDLLPEDEKGDELKKTVKERIKQEQLPEKAQEWFMNLEKNANIIKFVNY